MRQRQCKTISKEARISLMINIKFSLFNITANQHLVIWDMIILRDNFNEYSSFTTSLVVDANNEFPWCNNFVFILYSLCSYIKWSTTLCHWRKWRHGRSLYGETHEIFQFKRIIYVLQLSLRRLGHHICGATVISNFWVITAAHCVIKAIPSQVIFTNVI